jgi:hypothetical protein
MPLEKASPAACAAPAPARRQLPPLILHPFADSHSPHKLMESSRANLMLQGLLPTGDRGRDELDRALLEGRYQEIRMLFYVGRDLLRWIEQCMDFVSRQPDLAGRGIRPASFAAHLIEHTPASVEAKLRKWGVADYRAIFTRALGLNAVLAAVPPREAFSDDFLRNYYRYADQMFHCRQSQETFAGVDGLGFDYEIYASGEYSRMLEREWAEK